MGWRREQSAPDHGRRTARRGRDLTETDEGLLERWFLTRPERGNAAATVDRGDNAAVAYTVGNVVRPLVDGARYFARLNELLRELDAGCTVLFTDWRGDADERLAGPGTEIGMLLAGAARRGVDVRGLVWRSHPRRMHFSEQENRHVGQVVNEAGGEVLLDERVRRSGSHHQKMFVVRTTASPGDVAFVGGIDLGHGRHDDHRHRGDAQPIEIDARYGPRPAWHDIQVEIRGPAVGDVARTFRERWEDPLPLDHRTPWRARLARIAREPRRATALAPMGADPPPCGAHAVQVLRTYPAKSPPYPFAPRGERSVARAYMKAFARARAFIYIEDQYLWSHEAAEALATAMRRAPDLRVIAVVPRFPDRDGRVSGPAFRIGQQRAIERVRDAAPDRVAVFDLEAETGWPVYVHAKVCIVDDVWMTVGSDNLNRRSWTNDSEVTCAVIDGELDERVPRDPAGLGEGARRLPRDLRLELWREHVGGSCGDEQLLEPETGFATLARAAGSLDAWHAGERPGPRPPGRLRWHTPRSVGALTALWAEPAYRWLIDPDGRPRAMRRRARM